MRFKSLTILSLFAVALVLSSCDDKKSTSSGSNPISAPVDYLDAVAKAKISAEKSLDTVGINQAIQMFSTQEGRYPNELNELVSMGYLREIPKPPFGMKIVYNASKGEVKVVKE